MVTSNSNASDPFAAALRLLTGRDRSEAELSAKLKQLGFSTPEIEATLEKCREYNYLNDQRYALERARTMYRSGRGVGRKVLMELRRKGIDDATANQALEQVAGEMASDLLLRDLLERRFPGFDYRRADERQRRKVISFFQRRGFALAEIFSVLNQEA